MKSLKQMPHTELKKTFEVIRMQMKKNESNDHI